MNWFQRLWNNPNLHVAAGALSAVATPFFPQHVELLSTVAGILGTSGILLPEQAPILKPAEKSMHTEDYAALTAAIVGALKKK